MSRKRLGEILIGAGVLTLDQLEQGLRAQKRGGGQLGTALVREGIISEELLVRALSKQLNIPIVKLEGVRIEERVLDLVSADVCQKFGVLPFQIHGKFLDVATSDPMNMGILDELRIRTRLNVRPHLATVSDIDKTVRQAYGLGGGEAHDPIAFGNFIDEAVLSAPPDNTADMRDAEVASLQQRLATLEALVGRDENVIRKLMGLLVDKGVATREEILKAIGS